MEITKKLFEIYRDLGEQFPMPVSPGDLEILKTEEPMLFSTAAGCALFKECVTYKNGESLHLAVNRQGPLLFGRLMTFNEFKDMVNESGPLQEPDPRDASSPVLEPSQGMTL